MDAPLRPSARETLLRRLGKARRTRAGRWLSSLLVAVLAVYAVYLIAANVLLRTRLLRGWLSANETSLVLDYGSAWSLFPGKVVVHDFRMRYQDNVVQMSVSVDRATVDVDLWKLLDHEARLDHARAEGVEYRLRSKLETLDGNEGRARAFPRIDGFPDSVLAADQPVAEKRPGARWAVTMFDIEARARDIWTMEYRLRGETRIQGGFHVGHGSGVYVLPSSVHTHEGVLSLGDDDLVRGGDWSIEARLDPMSTKRVEGAGVFRYLDVVVRQDGGVVSLDPVSKTYLGPRLATTLAEGRGPIHVDVHLDHGIVRYGSRISYHTDRAVMHAGAFRLTSDLDVVARVELEGGPARVVAEAKTARGTLVPATDLLDLRAELAFGGVDVVMPIAIASLKGGIGLARTADMRVWNPVTDDAVTFEGGSASVAAKGDYHGGAFTGRVDTELAKVVMKTGPFWMRASGSSASDLETKNLTKDLVFRNTRADLSDMDLKLLGGHTEGVWLRARSNDTRITTSGEGSTDSHITVETGPGDAASKLLTRLAGLPDLAADVTAGKTISAKAYLRVRHDDVIVDIGEAEDGIVHGAARIHRKGPQPTSGAVLIKTGPLSAGVTFGRGTWNLHPLAKEEWFRGAAATH